MKAIVIADDHYNGLGLIRSLGKMGIEITLIMLDGNQSTMIGKSKYITKLIKSKSTEKDIVYNIKKSISKEQEYYIYPLNDFAAMICDRNRNEFGDNVYVPNAKGKVELYENKKRFSDIVKENNIRIPENMVIERESEDSVWTLFPAIIKPLKSIEGHKWDITIVNQKEELSAALNTFWKNGYNRVLIEQYITGADEHMVEIMGISDGKNVAFARIIRKIREYPIKNGSTAFAQLVEQHTDINLEKIEQLIKAIEFDGIFDVEFKYANEKSYFIELNFRNGAPAYVSTLDGFNLAYNWYLLHAGNNKSSIEKKSNGIDMFMVENRDIINMLKRQVPFVVWMKDFIRAKKLFFSISDIRPCIEYYKELFFMRHKKK